jgi:hypothetical protein
MDPDSSQTELAASVPLYFSYIEECVCISQLQQCPACFSYFAGAALHFSVICCEAFLTLFREWGRPNFHRVICSNAARTDTPITIKRFK